MTKTAKHILLILIAAIMGQFVRPAVQARPQPPQQTEYKLKAAFLLNFLHFIDWPRSAFAADSSSFVIGVVGEDPFDGVLEQIVKGESINGRSIIVRDISSAEEAKHCQLLFVTRAQRERYASYLQAVSGTSTLTVGEFEGFNDQGGGINFYLEDEKLRFEINLPIVQKSGLEVSSKLLRLAKIDSTRAKGN